MSLNTSQLQYHILYMYIICLSRMFLIHSERLQLLAKRFDLVEEVLHVGLLEARILQDETEEVGQLAKRLVGDHHGTLLDHGLLDFGCHLVQPVVELLIAFHLPQTGRHVPEGDIRALRLLQHQLEAGTFAQLGRKVFGHVKDLLHMRFEALAALGLPHKPELENIRATAALNVLVSGVEGCVVELVLLKQISGICRVALTQDL